VSLEVSSRARRAALPGAVVAALIATCVLALAAVPRAEANPPSGVPATFFGVSGRYLDNQDFEDLEVAGVGTYRTLVNFRNVKRRPTGGYNWDHFDKLIGRMASRDIRVLPLLYGTPSWIYRHATVPPIYTPEAREAWSRLLVQFTDRYGPNGNFWRLNPLIPYHPVTAWQIWNEPNSAGFWPSAPDPGEYARLLRLSAAAINSIDPKATIVSAGLVANPQGLGSMPGDVYLQRLAASPIVRETVDAYGYHPYAKNARGVRAELRDARLALRAEGEGTAPIWVTEVGWGSDSLIDKLLLKTRQGQAEMLERTYATVLARRRKLGIERMLWYYWRDQPDPLCVWCRSAGLLERSHERKPAFVAFRRLTGS
jgi:hypothetical protein